MADQSLPLAPGSSLGPHYIVDERIGEGGMGVVYRGRDTRLGRSVALKVLPDASGDTVDSLHRFEQEARAASALNHPNIVTIYEIGHADGVHFIAQELVDGMTLRQRLTDGPLPVETAIDIAVQVASALDAAHHAGVVHRDIKPENIMLRRDGIAKVLDFGLAKLAPPVPAPDAETVFDLRTQPGVVLGTVSYMSPEQARGGAVDARSDIFSLGVVLYEMIAGRTPFAGMTFADRLVATLQEKPTPLGQIVPGTPPEIDRIVAKALRKDADQRYQGIKDLLVDLRALTHAPESDPVPPAEGRRRRSKVVLGAAVGVVVAVTAIGVWYFMSGRTQALTEKDTLLLTDFTNNTGEPVFDGGTLRQALAVQLQQTPFLNLFPDEAIGTTLAMMERKPDERVIGAVAREICQRQGLKAMVTGTISRLGQHYVITLEAANAQSGETIAIQQGEAQDAEHVLQVLGAAATGLREKLGESLSTLQKYNAPIEKATTGSLEALKAYSAGQALLQREDGRAALPLYERAIELDPDFVAAYDNGAWAHTISGNPIRAAHYAEEGYRRRERATEREQLSVTSTYHHFATGDWEEELRQCDVWSRLFPNDYQPYTCAPLNGPLLGQLEDGVEAAKTLIRVSPSVAQGYRFLATSLVPLQRYDEALQAIAQGRSKHLDNVFLRRADLAIAVARDDTANIDRAIEASRRDDGEREALTWKARIAASLGRWRETGELFRQMQPATLRAATGPVPLPIEGLGLQSLIGFCRPNDTAPFFAPSRIVSAGLSYPPAVATDGSLCGDTAAAERFADELARRYPASTNSREISLPQLRAAIALGKNDPATAIEALRPTRAAGSLDALRTLYLRGQAHLRQKDGAKAAADFQAIIDHRGWSPTSALYPLAYVGLGRADVLAGDTGAARKAYEAFLARWKNADADIPALVEAKKEYAALGRP